MDASTPALIPVWEKANLTVDEAAAYFGLGKAKIRAMTDASECPYVLWCGAKRLIKRKRFEEYLNGLYSI